MKDVLSENVMYSHHRYRLCSKYASEEIWDRFVPNVCLSTLNMVKYGSPKWH